MQLVQKVAPLTQPLTLTETKEFLRVLGDEDDLLIGALISAVREFVENFTNRQLISATFELLASDFISKLPKSPIQSIEKIEYMDTVTGSYVELDSSTYYLYEHNGIGCINYAAIPSVIEHHKAVKITFVCGYQEVPESIKAYMKVKVSTFYEHREDLVIGTIVSEMKPSFIDNLLSPYRVWSV